MNTFFGFQRFQHHYFRILDFSSLVSEHAIIQIQIRTDQ